MKVTKNVYGEYVIEDTDNRYNERISAQPTARILPGSRDDGYDQEYIGYGTISDVPVKAIYLLSEDDYNLDDEGEHDEDAGNWDWETALSNGRIIIDVDKLSDDANGLLTILSDTGIFDLV